MPDMLNRNKLMERMMETCKCRYDPILGPNGEYVGGNIIYCVKHAAAPELYDALYQNYLWMKVHQRDGPLSTNSDGFNRLLDKADAIIVRVMESE